MKYAKDELSPVWVEPGVPIIREVTTKLVDALMV